MTKRHPWDEPGHRFCPEDWPPDFAPSEPIKSDAPAKARGAKSRETCLARGETGTIANLGGKLRRGEAMRAAVNKGRP